MKKFLLSIAVLAGLSAAAQTFAVGDLNYTVTGTATVEVSGLANSTATSIDVPATVENGGTTYTVTAIGDQAFRWASITSAIIPSSVEVIKHGAFNGADLVSITLNEGLKEIGDYSLACKYLTAIDVPSTVTRIGDEAFFSCEALYNVTFSGKDKSTVGKEIRLHRTLRYKCPLPLECAVYKKCPYGRSCTSDCP